MIEAAKSDFSTRGIDSERLFYDSFEYAIDE